MPRRVRLWGDCAPLTLKGSPLLLHRGYQISQQNLSSAKVLISSSERAPIIDADIIDGRSTKRERRTLEVRTSHTKLAKKLGCSDFAKAADSAETRASQALQLVGIEGLTERLFADQRAIGQFLLAGLEPRQHVGHIVRPHLPQ
jgi:hypothetical protein